MAFFVKTFLGILDNPIKFDYNISIKDISIFFPDHLMVS